MGVALGRVAEQQDTSGVAGAGVAAGDGEAEPVAGQAVPGCRVGGGGRARQEERERDEQA
ncbi:hypothetical protein [Streptomyces sp. LN245]|uniref:hypothetical protein n=1 Tax=Streptomyces sp. LN245 TaxID=3112975 RepID=UPI003715F96D